MATLPTPDLTDEKAAEVLSAFGGEQSYTEWLTTAIADRIVSAEAQRQRDEDNRKLNEFIISRRQEVIGELRANGNANANANPPA
jgi:hypothetical protein